MENFNKLIDLAKSGAPSAQNDLDNRLYVSSENARRTIFLADLPRTTTYMDLNDYFERKVGPCLIAIKRPLFKNFYFAFIQFRQQEHADKVLGDYRFPMIRGEKCRALPYNFQVNGTFSGVSGKASKVSKESSETYTIFVKNCPKDWTHEDLFKTFESFGTIASAKMSIDASFNSRGFGFVSFETQRAVNKAIKEVNGKRPQDLEPAPSSESDQSDKAADEEVTKLIVTEYKSKQDRYGTMKPRCSTNLYVKNFPGSQRSNSDEQALVTETQFTDDDLRKEFEKFGEIANCTVMRDDEGNSRGFGFVCYNDWQDAQRALNHFDEERQDGKHGLYVVEAKSKEERQLEIQKKTFQFKKSMQFMNLIVKNVCSSATEDDLREFFSNFGQVHGVKCLPEKQCAFVSFKDRESARAARTACTDKLFKGRYLYANFCEPKESRHLAFEEKMDKRAFENHQARNMSSKNSDLVSLITSLGMLMGQLNGGGAPRQQYRGTPQQRHFPQQMNNSMDMQQANYQQNYAQLPMQNRRPRNQRQVQNGYGQNQVYNNSQSDQSQPVQSNQVIGVMPSPQQNQSMLPQASNGFAMQTSQQLPQKASDYGKEIFDMFQSQQFMQSTIKERRTIIGTAIFKHVEELVGIAHAPKVTGMIIDLDPVELNQSVLNWEALKSKVGSAMRLLIEKGIVQQPQTSVDGTAKQQDQHDVPLSSAQMAFAPPNQ